MRNKIIVIFIVMLLSISGMQLVFDDVNVIADTGGEEGEYLDYQLVYDVTEDLSKIVNDVYDVENGELAKGRAFGSKGEHWAANYLNNTFNDILNITAYTERIENIPCPLFKDYSGGLNLTDKIEIKEMSILLNGTDPIEGVIRPRWNLTIRGEGNIPFKNLPPKNGPRDQLYHYYDFTRLTHNFSYENIEIIKASENHTWFNNAFTEKCCKDFEENFTGDNWLDFLDFFLPWFEDYHNFSFSDVNESNAEELLNWSYNSEYFPTCQNNEPFIYIRENPSFNPNPIWPEYPPIIKRIINRTGDHYALEIVEMMIWRLRGNYDRISIARV